MGKTPQLSSGVFSPGYIVSQHPIPWRNTTHPEEQVAIELTSISPTVSIDVGQVVYRFSTF